MKRKVYILATLVLFASILLSACSQKGSSEEQYIGNAIQSLKVTCTSLDTGEPMVNVKQGYLYAVMDIAALTEEDLNAIADYLAAISSTNVVVVDAGRYKNAVELYSAMKEDSATREGDVSGVQIFGTPEMVPAFYVQYRAQMLSGVHEEEEEFLSDFFYGNFENISETIGYGYNVKAHFDEKLSVDLIPQWPVARLPLEKGEFGAFFEKYTELAKETKLQRLTLVNFSNPIFAQEKHSDDMNEFLLRMDNEFGLLDVEYKLYGNLAGDYPVTSDVSGDFSVENMAAENDLYALELLINAHGNEYEIVRTVFENDSRKDTVIVDKNNINEMLDTHPYYMDTWSCALGCDMNDNLVVEALKGKCVGAFAATTYMSNNGVEWDVPIETMRQSNFFYFYYSYLKALHEGSTRCGAFLEAQRAYGKALIEDSVNELRGEGNYQFGLYNLLTYHNFGVLEPDVLALTEYECNGYIER